MLALFVVSDGNTGALLFSDQAFASARSGSAEFLRIGK